MELRRALLLFAIVLGLSAIATSVSGPREDDRDPQPRPAAPSTPTTGPPPASGPLEVRFEPSARQATERLEAGRAATVVVEVEDPGEVALEGLGLSAAAEPLTPARFDVLVNEPGRHSVRFTPATNGEARTLGTLAVTR